MSKILETLNIADPEKDDIPGYTMNGNTDVVSVSDDELATVETEGSVQVDDSVENELINEGHDDINDIINDTLSNAKHIAELARDYEPRSQARMYEVGGQYYKTALDAIKAKQDMAHKTKQHNLEKAKTGAPLQGGMNLQNNHFYGSREEILEMLRGNKEKTIDHEEITDEDDS